MADVKAADKNSSKTADDHFKAADILVKVADEMIYQNKNNIGHFRPIIETGLCQNSHLKAAFSRERLLLTEYAPIFDNFALEFLEKKS